MMDFEEIKRQILVQANCIELNLDRNRWLSLLRQSLENKDFIKGK